MKKFLKEFIKYFFILVGVLFTFHFLMLSISVWMTKDNTKIERIYPFTSDGCSMFIDGDYRDCCETHDRAYWEGGPLYKKLIADAYLYACVAEKGHNFRENLMFPGVLLGGNPGFPTTFRWGYGYPYPYYDIRKDNN